ncbi:MAG: cysteine-rich CWC family protein [Arcobacteraceae bacterium]
MIKIVQNEILENLQNTNSDYTRLFHGRGGCFKGFEFLTVDAIDTLLFVVFFQECEAQLEKELFDFFETLQTKGFQTAVVQRRYLEKAPSQMLFGSLKEETVALENGLHYHLSFLHHQNIGFFADMKQGREFVAQVCENKNVLNLFSYTCSFSVVAIQHGAKQVVNVDMSKAALSTGRENHRLNSLSTQHVKFLPYNILKSWSKIKKYAPYDLIIIDPPSFQKGSFAASKDYEKIIKRLDELANAECTVLACLNDPILDEAFIQTIFQQHASQFIFEQRLGNVKAFKTNDENRSLKNLVFKKQIDANICPLCKKPNVCKAKSSESCWCNHIEVPLELRALVPLEYKMKACICRECIEAFNANQSEFVNDLKRTSL